MSKYNLCVNVSRWRYVLIWLTYGLLATSVTTWLDDIIVHQTLWQWLLGSLILLAGWQQVSRDRHNAKPRWFNVDESGKGQWIDQIQLQQWQISKHSRMTEIAVWMTLADASNPAQKQRFVWLANQFCDRDYRRLCRIIARCQQQSLI